MGSTMSFAFTGVVFPSVNFLVGGDQRLWEILKIKAMDAFTRIPLADWQVLVVVVLSLIGPNVIRRPAHAENWKNSHEDDLRLFNLTEFVEKIIERHKKRRASLQRLNMEQRPLVSYLINREIPGFGVRRRIIVKLLDKPVLRTKLGRYLLTDKDTDNNSGTEGSQRLGQE